METLKMQLKPKMSKQIMHIMLELLEWMVRFRA